METWHWTKRPRKSHALKFSEFYLWSWSWALVHERSHAEPLVGPGKCFLYLASPSTLLPYLLCFLRLAFLLSRSQPHSSLVCAAAGPSSGDTLTPDLLMAHFSTFQLVSNTTASQRLFPALPSRHHPPRLRLPVPQFHLIHFYYIFYFQHVNRFVVYLPPYNVEPLKFVRYCIPRT